MIKNAFLYRLVSEFPDFTATEEALHAAIFTPCGATQEKSTGWVPPRGHEHGALLESVGGQWIFKLQTETKKVPGQAIKDKVAEQCKAIEAQTGRKPGRKETRELQDDARLALLPNAFAARAATLIWLDPEARTLVVDAGSQSKADDAVTALVRSIDGLALQLVNTQMSPAAAMALWLGTKEAPEGFTVDRECELKACDESKAVVRYGRHALDIDEVAQHIAMGKMPTKLALTYNDRVSFVLTESLVLKKIAILDVVFEAASHAEHEDHFDADVTIATGELSKLLAGLVDVLGGVVQS